MSLWLWIFPCIIGCICVFTFIQDLLAAKMGPPTILMETVTMVGDSITQGAWALNGTGAALANAYQRKLDVVNRGFAGRFSMQAGYNSVWALAVAKEFLPKKTDHLPKMALMTIWLGANDAALPPSPQSITVEEFKAALHSIINLVKDSNSPWYSPTTKFLLITPPPVEADVRNNELMSRIPARVPDRDTERTRLFAVAVLEVGQEAGVPVVDTWTAITQRAAQTPEGLSKFLSDGLHLTAEGYGVVTEGVANAIATRLPELHWDRLGEVFPAWTEIVNEGALEPILAKYARLPQESQLPPQYPVDSKSEL
ncbi:BZ3500_MvSof-1268-A1-R1_Chr4-2g07177 [Microbotryum saponariae]|uniref:BZ3500_MvSof-1268-A1-R1_Chr4-2g07177 protein n=1 Tax=Microbotryum saponariae TaxID=289078 RepID=A0A2X0NGJ6_9BASI|nr:BZ3500_MvSof-1268-A1-R1_Chr4-2g07177 [Microbotryum saponariae]SDA06842.1 BZ3501_MvSof-1269-A2-R1_Chr4-2g06888 [Microbotryum saponariae]